MKTKLLFIITFSCCLQFLTYSSFAQLELTPAQELAWHKRTMKDFGYIFEGVVTQQVCYLIKNKRMYTYSVISILKIFKGSPKIKLGSIKVITDQGGTVVDSTANNASMLLIENDFDGGGEALCSGKKYIIFGAPADSIMLIDKMITTDNSLVLFTSNPITFINSTVKRGGRIYHLDRPAATWDDTQFKTLDELYAYLKENGSLIIQEEVVKPKQSVLPADSTKQKK